MMRLVLAMLLVWACGAEEYCLRAGTTCDGMLAAAEPPVEANSSACRALCDEDPACRSVSSHGLLCNLLTGVCRNHQLQERRDGRDYYKHSGPCGGGLVRRVTGAALRFWTYSCFLLGPLGVVSNLLILLVLARDRPSSTNILFSTIAVFDTVVIFASFNYFGDKISFGDVDVSLYYQLSPLVSFCKKISVHMLLLMTLERYMAVCRALDGSWFTYRRTLVSILVIAVTDLGIVALTEMPYIHAKDPGLVEGTPHMVEYRRRSVYKFADVYDNPGLSRFGTLDVYTGTYYHSGILNFIIEFVLPWPGLLLLNGRIIREIRRARRTRERMSGSSSSGNDVTKSLVCVVLVFMVCELPRKVGFFLLPNHFLIPERTVAAFLVVEYTGRVLSVISASVNLYIYLLTGSRFRRLLLTAVCPGARGEADKSASTATSKIH